jgi:copper chaperone CopZ
MKRFFTSVHYAGGTARAWLVMALLFASIAACGGSAADGTADSAGTSGGEVGVSESRPAAPDSGDAAALQRVTLTVPGMSCPLCTRSIEARLAEAGLRDVVADLETKRVRARFDPRRITLSEIRSLVEGQGYEVTGASVERAP